MLCFAFGLLLCFAFDLLTGRGVCWRSMRWPILQNQPRQGCVARCRPMQARSLPWLACNCAQLCLLRPRSGNAWAWSAHKLGSGWIHCAVSSTGSS